MSEPKHAIGTPVTDTEAASTSTQAAQTDTEKIDDLIGLMPISTGEKKIVSAATHAVLKTADYAPPISMRTRGVLYVIGMVLMLVVIFAAASWALGIDIPKVVLALVITVAAAVGMIFFTIAHKSNQSQGTIY